MFPQVPPPPNARRGAGNCGERWAFCAGQILADIKYGASPIHT